MTASTYGRVPSSVVVSKKSQAGSARRWRRHYLRRALLDCSRDGEDRARVLVDLVAAERTFDVGAAVRTMTSAVSLFASPRDRAAALIRVAPVVMSDAPSGLVSLLGESGGATDPADLARMTGVDRDLALRLDARLRCCCTT